MRFEYKKLIFVAIIIIMFFLLREYFSYSFILLDDIHTAIFDSFKNILKKPSNGIFIASFFDGLFTTYLPRLLDIHPSVFKSQFFSYVESFFVLSFIFIFSAIFYTKKKIDFFYLVCFLYSSFLLLFIIQQQSYVLFVYDGFFRMLLPSFLWLSLFYLIFSSSKDVTKGKLFFVSLLSFLTCISNEMLCVSTVIGLMLYSIFQIRNKNYNVILIFLCSILGCFVLIKTGAFLRKSGGTIPNFFVCFNDFGPFVCDYVKHIFARHSVGLLLIVFQMIFLFLKKGEEQRVQTTFLLIFSFFIGVLAFLFSLIFLGRTHYVEGEYWIVHPDLHMIYSFILAGFNFVLLKLIIDYELISKKIIIMVFSITSLYLMFQNFSYYHDFYKNKILPLKVEYYKSEKILRIAAKKEKIAVLDIENAKNGYFWPFLYEISASASRENFKYESSPIIMFLNQFEDEKDKIKLGYMFLSSEKVEEEFKNNGGFFDEEELENIDFNRLKNNKE